MKSIHLSKEGNNTINPISTVELDQGFHSKRKRSVTRATGCAESGSCEELCRLSERRHTKMLSQVDGGEKHLTCRNVRCIDNNYMEQRDGCHSLSFSLIENFYGNYFVMQHYKSYVCLIMFVWVPAEDFCLGKI